MKRLEEVMRTDLVIVDRSACVEDAVHAMTRARTGSVLVLDRGRLVGIFTERDFIRAVSQSSSHENARMSRVWRWMTAQPVTSGPDATIGAALDLMVSGRFRHLPVVEGEEVVGVVSMRDLAKAVAED